VQEIRGCLFKAPASFSLCHCVAEDLRMGAGIARTFKKYFGCPNSLIEQKKRVGEVAYQFIEGRFIFYLITKKYSTFSFKPKYCSLPSSLLELKKCMLCFKINDLAMPYISCGIDGYLKWDIVKKLLLHTFSDCNINIRVYYKTPL
jgi:hypothetical protein